MPNFIEGEILLVDKPLTWTSFDVVNKLRFKLRVATQQKKIKVGHAGTLDPLASGLLIVCCGKKTKIIDSIQGQEKEYTGIIKIGATTASYDLETEEENKVEYHHITKEMILEAVESLTGEIEQVPPAYSAKKIDGKRAYKLARKGEAPTMKSKSVTVHSFEIKQIELPEIHFRIACSKGTYIRSLAHDLGQLLKVGGYLKSLRRTKIGDYKIEDAQTIEALGEYIESNATVA